MLAKPDFLCIGAKKAGTTWIYDQLQHHPQVWMPPTKEIYAFNDPSLYPRDIGRLNRRRAEVAQFARNGVFTEADRTFLDKYLRNTDFSFDWYTDLFAEAAGRRTGDVDPNIYAMYLGRLALLARIVPALKLILILRNPVSRSWSHMSMLLKQKNINPADIHPQELIDHMRQGHIYMFSNYVRILDQLQKMFPPERLLCLAFDEIALDTPALLRRVWAFLGISPIDLPATATEKSNPGSGAVIPPAVHDGLYQRHRPDQERVLALLGIGERQLQL